MTFCDFTYIYCSEDDILKPSYVLKYIEALTKIHFEIMHAKFIYSLVICIFYY